MTEDVEVLLDNRIAEKLKDLNEVEEVEQEDPILLEFNNERFSDIAVFGFGKTWKLHKLMLIQSPMLKEKINDTNVILLETVGWPKSLDSTGIEKALKSLYRLDSSKNLISIDIAFKVLVAACFLELHDLATKCYRRIEMEMSNLQNIIDMPSCIDSLKFRGNSALNAPGQFLLEKYFRKLSKACLGSLLYCASLCDVNGAALEENNPAKFTKAEESLSTSQFLSQLPLGWIQLVLEHDALTVKTEFQRYELAKKIFELRQANPPKVNVDYSELIDASLESENTRNSRPLTVSKQDSIGSSLFNFLFSSSRETAKKRKLDQEFFLPLVDENHTSTPTVDDRIIKSARGAKKPSAILPTTLSNIYQRGIVYTFMSFEELGVVKRDEIVPSYLVLESFWLQTELTKSGPRALSDNIGKLSSLRFAFRFDGVNSFFNQCPRPTSMPSDPINCAGVQYRLYLGCSENDQKELYLKALLQKTKGKGPKVAYSIFMFDHRQPPTSSLFLSPVTTCGTDGHGVVNEIPFNIVKGENCKDSLWLSIALTFYD